MLTVRDSMLASPDVFVLAFSSMFGATIGLIGGVIIMAGQLLLLPNRVTAVQDPEWFKATTIGMALGWGLGSAAPLYVASYAGLHEGKVEGWIWSGAIVAALAGVVVGRSQWRILRHYLKHAYWWIVASAVGWAAGGATYWIAYRAVGGPLFMPWSPNFTLEPWPGWLVFLWANIVGWIAGGTIVGVVIGIALKL